MREKLNRIIIIASIAVVMIVTAGLTGCGLNAADTIYKLPDNPEVFQQEFCEIEDTGRNMQQITWNGRSYVYYGDLKGYMNADKEIAECLGYLYNENAPEDTNNRVCTLTASEDFLEVYYVNGIMETPFFYRALDTRDKDIEIPGFIGSRYDPIWGEEYLREWTNKKSIQAAEKMLGLDLSGATQVLGADNHGGFHGDGTLLLKFTFSEDILIDGSAGEGWHDFPLTANGQTIAGNDGLVTDPYGNEFFPAVEHGYYFFYDRHSDAADPYDDSFVHSRSSWNFTFAIYDLDAHVLYYTEFDT